MPFLKLPFTVLVDTSRLSIVSLIHLTISLLLWDLVIDHFFGTMFRRRSQQDSQSDMQTNDEIMPRLVMCENIVGINLPRVASAEFRMKDLATRISALERRAGYEHPSAPEGEAGTFPAIASHRGEGAIASTRPRHPAPKARSTIGQEMFDYDSDGDPEDHSQPTSVVVVNRKVRVPSRSDSSRANECVIQAHSGDGHLFCVSSGTAAS